MIAFTVCLWVSVSAFAYDVLKAPITRPSTPATPPETEEKP